MYFLGLGQGDRSRTMPRPRVFFPSLVHVCVDCVVSLPCQVVAQDQSSWGWRPESSEPVEPLSAGRPLTRGVSETCRRDKALSTDGLTCQSRQGGHCTPLVKGAWRRPAESSLGSCPEGPRLRECPRLALMATYSGETEVDMAQRWEALPNAGFTGLRLALTPQASSTPGTWVGAPPPRLRAV